MTRRTHTLNSQTHAMSRMGVLQPVQFTEVAPGDTVSGTQTIKMISAAASEPIMNMAYTDVYNFYVPYRILWDGFPDFITTGTGAVPTVDDLWDHVWEKAYTNTDSAGEWTRLVPWHRRAYNAIWNEYFRLDSQTEITTDQRETQRANYTQRDFHRAEPEAAITTTTIDTSGSTLAIDDVREALAKDQFNKIREIYGERYVDYMNALGVSTPWTILEAPERVSHTSNRPQFNTIHEFY